MDALRLRAVLLGRDGGGRDRERRGPPGPDPSAQNLYNAACALSLLDRANHSTTHRKRVDSLLKRAFAMGFPRDQAANDPDLQ